jgi:hypothetical protein
MASLVSAYADDDDVDDELVDTKMQPEKGESSPSPEHSQPDHERTYAHFISDDEDHHSSPAHSSERPSSTEPPAERPINKRLNIEPVDKSEQNTQSPSFPSLERKPTLVSYATDEVDDMDEDESEHSDESLPGIFGLVNSKGTLVHNVSSASITVRSDIEATGGDASSPHVVTEDDIQLPPEPPGSCSKRLQEKVAKFYEQARDGTYLNKQIQRRKDFRNPSIYEKLVQFCGIDEKGTNYPPELYNPLIWGPESYYDELARVQMEWIHEKEKEKEAKKSKVEFQKGVKKIITAETLAMSSDNKRKSKWDEQGTTASSSSTAVAAKSK